jgi:osmotically-inducible protein OsmY
METTDRRPDLDIEEDIGRLITSFAPLKASRGYFTFQSENGYVRVSGNVHTPQARRVLLDNIPRIKGVVGTELTDLYDDEMVRFAIGQLLPPGVLATVHYGAVALTGTLPDGASESTIVQAVEAVPGVRRVGVNFSPRPKPVTESTQSPQPNLGS